MITKSLDSSNFSSIYSHPQWRSKRVEVFKHKGKKCEKCSSTKNLEIHHIIYKEGHELWEYSNDELQVLCSKCHRKTHGIIGKKYCTNLKCATKPRPEIEDKYELCFPCYRNISRRLEDLKKQHEKKLNEARNYYKLLSSKNKSLIETLGERDEYIEAKDKKFKELESLLIERDLFIEDLDKAYSDLLSSEKDFKERNALERKIDSLKIENEKNQKKYKNENNSLKIEIEKLDKEINKLKKSNIKSKKNENEISKNFNDLKTLVNELKTNNRLLENNYYLSNEELSILEKENKVLENKFNETLNKLKKIEKENDMTFKTVIIIVGGLILALGVGLFIGKDNSSITINIPQEELNKSFSLENILDYEDKVIDQIFEIDEVYIASSTTFFNIGGKFPHHKLGLNLPDSSSSNFEHLKPFSSLEGKKIRVIGKVKKYRGKATIFINEKNQIELQ